LATAFCLARGQLVTAELLQSIIEEYVSTDDVFRHEFLQGVVFEGASGKGVDDLVTPDAVNFLQSFGTQWIEIANNSNPARPGPYLAFHQKLMEVYRLYDDIQRAFLTSFIPGEGE
jgi:hypothetical protein